MILLDVILLLLIVWVGYLFWLGRRQAEQAHRYIERYCQQHQLQLLDCAWQRGYPAKRGRYVGWLSHYEFRFSSDGETRYVGSATLLNLRLVQITTPPYRLPAESDLP